MRRRLLGIGLIFAATVVALGFGMPPKFVGMMYLIFIAFGLLLAGMILMLMDI